MIMVLEQIGRIQPQHQFVHNKSQCHKRQYANVSDEDDDTLPDNVVSLHSAFDVEFQSRMCFMQG
jgi:hypothetical protein